MRINIPDSPRASARMSNQALSLLMQQQVGIEAILHYTCRDRNVLCIQSDLLGAAAIGIHNLICITGDPPKMGNYPDATAVFDVDAIGLVNIVHNLNRGLDIGGNPIGSGTSFRHRRRRQSRRAQYRRGDRRFEYKVEAGAEYAVTQPVFDLACWKISCGRIEHCRIPGDRRHLAAGQRPQRRVHEERTARFGAGRDSRAHGRAPQPEAAREEGVAIAREMLVCGPRHGARRADQRPAGTVLVCRGRAGGAGRIPNLRRVSRGPFPFWNSCLQIILLPLSPDGHFHSGRRVRMTAGVIPLAKI